jgi:hypothetical protein
MISHLQSSDLLLRKVFPSGLLIFSFLQGRIIKRAFGKLKLEHVVIGKGQFEQDRSKPNALDVISPCTPSIIDKTQSIVS